MTATEDSLASAVIAEFAGGHLNPAVTLGLAAQGIVGSADLVVYPLTQLAVVFACLASARWQRLAPVAAGAVALGDRQPRTGKLVHDPSIPCYVRCELPHITATARAVLIAELK